MAIKDVTIYFTSGTGNSYRAAEWCAAVGQKRGVRTRVLRIEGARPGEELKPGRDALVGLAMQPDAACVRRSRPKPEGYPDRLLSNSSLVVVGHQNFSMYSTMRRVPSSCGT